MSDDDEGRFPSLGTPSDKPESQEGVAWQWQGDQWVGIPVSSGVSEELIEHTYAPDDWVLSTECSRCEDCEQEGRETVTVWAHTRSPDWTWQRLCGREGWLALCSAHGRTLGYRITMMN